MRVIANAHFRAHSAPLFLQFGVLDIFKVNSLCIAKFIFWYKNQMLQPRISILFTTNNKIHNYNTRTAGNYRSHACRTNLKQFTILYQGPKKWNAVPPQIKLLSSFSSFKKTCDKVLVEINSMPHLRKRTRK